MLLSIGVAGLPFAGADVGGFFGNPDGELMTRWYQLGVYYPFFRGHAHHEAARREPWLFGEPYTDHIRAALRERYALLPYIYTLFAASAGHGGAAAAWAGGEAAARAGSPVARPLWAEFPADPAALRTEGQLMLGDALLICPVLAQGATSVDCYLPGPGSLWFPTAADGDGAALAGGSRLSVPAPLSAPAPAWLRAGAVLPRRERPRRSSAAAAADPYTLWVAADGGGGARGELYLDDGASPAHAAGAFSRRLFSLQPADGGALTLRCGALGPQGYKGGALVERVAFFGLPPARGWVASLPGGESVALEAAEAAGGAPAPAGSLLLRAPGVEVGQDWSITLRPL